MNCRSRWLKLVVRYCDARQFLFLSRAPAQKAALQSITTFCSSFEQHNESAKVRRSVMASITCCRRMATVPSQARFLGSRLGRLASYSTPLRRASRAVSTTTRLPHVRGTSAGLLRNRYVIQGIG